MQAPGPLVRPGRWPGRVQGRDKRGRDGTHTEALPGAGEHQAIAEHCAGCLLRGQPLRHGPAEAAANLRVIEALRRSARNDGKPEPVQP